MHRLHHAGLVAIDLLPLHVVDVGDGGVCVYYEGRRLTQTDPVVVVVAGHCDEGDRRLASEWECERLDHVLRPPLLK